MNNAEVGNFYKVWRRLSNIFFGVLTNPVTAIFVGLPFNIASLVFSKTIQIYLASHVWHKDFNDDQKVLITVVLGLLPSIIILILRPVLFLLVFLFTDPSSYLKFFRTTGTLSVVGKQFAAHELRLLLHSHQPINIRQGVLEVVKSLTSSSGAELTSSQFARLCGIIAGFCPDAITGVWNATWYRLEDVYALKDGKYTISNTWEPYFTQLAIAAKTQTANNLNRRYLILDDVGDKYLESCKAVFEHFLAHQASLKVEEVCLVPKGVYQELFSDEMIDIFGDLAIFQIQPRFISRFLFTKSWLIGTKVQHDQSGDWKPGATVLYDETQQINRVLESIATLTNKPSCRWFRQGKSASIECKDGKGTWKLWHNKSLGEKWDIVSNAYHKQEELNAIIKIIEPFRDCRVHDAACGTGFPLIGLHKAGFANVTGSDRLEANLDVLRIHAQAEGVLVNAVCADFLGLAGKGIRDVDVLLCSGSSLTYCDTWSDEQLEVKPNNEGVLEAISGMKDAIKSNGLLVIGNSKLYKNDPLNSQINVVFPTIPGVGCFYTITWQLNFDWNQCIKIWNCTILDNNSSKWEINMKSHLFDSSMLIDICKKHFKYVQEAATVDECPETYILCSDSDSIIQRASNGTPTPP